MKHLKSPVRMKERGKRTKHKVMLIIRDGWGYTTKTEGNCVKQANLKNDSYYMKNYPWTILKASGNAVGIPKGIMGGSEVGHLTIGAGRIVWQPLEMINKSIKDKSFYKNKALNKAIAHVKKNKSKLHLIGLFSDLGVHGTTDHIFPMLKFAKDKGIHDVYVHCFLDGRDAPEKSALKYIRRFKKKSKEIGIGKIATMIGRYYAMDRDTNWDRIRKAYDLLVMGKGTKEKDPIKAVKNAYMKGDKTDYYVRPIAITGTDSSPLALIEDNDAVIDWDFRSDRERQITAAIAIKGFNKFKRDKVLKNICYVCMSEYDKTFDLPVAFLQLSVENNLGKIISDAGLNQLRIAETEKYAHVTFFFNSQREKPSKGEDRMLAPSPKVSSYAEKPEMSAYKTTEKVIKEIKKEKYDFILMNFANGDLVGHSGDIKAGIKACKAVDKCIGRIVENCLEHSYIVIITADHGNVENMLYPGGAPRPAHGMNPVPFILLSSEEMIKNARLRKGCGLKDIAPTVIEIMDLEKPREMTGKSLIMNKF